jgi:hypothetical protein
MLPIILFNLTFLYPTFSLISLKFGIFKIIIIFIKYFTFIPIGIPLDPNAIISNAVKSGFLKISLSNYFSQGKKFKNSLLFYTNYIKSLLSVLSTTATNPLHSPLLLRGST